MPESKRTDYPIAQAIGKFLGHAFVFFFAVWFVFKGAWDTLIPNLFPGAAEQGLVAKSISWWTAFLLSGTTSMIGLWMRQVGGSWFGSADKRIPVIEVKITAIATRLGIDLDAAIRAEVARLCKADKKQAIALYRNYTGADLASAKEYVNGLPGSAEPSAAPSPQPGAAADRPPG